MSWILITLLQLGFFPACIKGQQQYSANSVMSCNNSDETEPSPAFLYSCNGQYSSCKAFLIFRAHSPYNSVPAIANLTSSNQSEIARINNVPWFTVFPEEQEVIIPVICSCSGRYYQANATYTIQSALETYFITANSTYQGLSTCDSLERSNVYDEFRLRAGLELEVPLRCACPTMKQAAKGTKYLLTYIVIWHDDVPYISKKFNVSRLNIAEANGFSEENPTLFPFTTLLIPLPSEPLSSTIIARDNIPTISSQPAYEDQGIRSRRILSTGGIIAAGLSPVVLLTFFFIVFIMYKKRFGRVQSTEAKEESNGISPEDIHVEIASIDHVIKIFEFNELKRATRNFISKCRIKGCVYRGVLGKEVLAIKKMSKGASKEVNILSRINHFNLIKLHGFCEYHGSFYLVFEYMKNGSLQEWLSKKGPADGKTWTQRIQISLDIASGLLYLHRFTKPAYVHMDIKSTNILLDSNLRAKITNFSLAKAATEEPNRNAMTSKVIDTNQYMAPEYIETGMVTPKLDVYAFGMVLLELITGKDADIATSVAKNAKDELNNFVEDDILENGAMEQAFQFIKLSLSCLMQDPANRPSMDDVVSSLIRIQMNVQKSDKDVGFCCN